jgi:hypothetical protein
MKTQPGKALSKDDLVAEMKRVHALVGRHVLTTADFNRHSVTSTFSIRKRFGSWKNALEVAGIAQSELANRWTEEQCFENLAAVWTHFGEHPSYDEMFSPPSTISGQVYRNRWGTWRKALRAFVTWANAEGENETKDQSDLTSQRTAKEIRVKPNPVRRSEEEQRQVAPRIRFKVFQRDRFKCVACGRSPATHMNVVLHADHIDPVALGGKTVLENLRALCEDCNLGKGKMPG